MTQPLNKRLVTEASLAAAGYVSAAALSTAVNTAVATATASAPMVWFPTGSPLAFPARPATNRVVMFLSSTVTPTLDGSLAGGGGMVPNHDIWIRALP